MLEKAFEWYKRFKEGRKSLKITRKPGDLAYQHLMTITDIVLIIVIREKVVFHAADAMQFLLTF